MRILFITEKFPYPLNNGGNIRTYHILRCLSERHSVTLFSIEPETDKTKAVNFIKEICDVKTFPRKRRSAPWKAFYMLQSMLYGKPYPINKNYSAAMKTALRNALQNSEFDALHFNHIDAAVYFDLIPKNIKLFTVFDTHNIISELLCSMKEESRSSLRHWFINIQERKFRKLEYRYFSSVDRCLVCSQEEEDKIKKHQHGANLAVVPNGVDTEHFTRRVPYPDVNNKTLKIVFVGAMGYYPNAEGVLFFAKRVLPLIVKKKPDVEFLVVGSDPTKEIMAIKSPVRVLGHVDDVRDYMEEGHVFVVPLRSGGGTRLKVLDALALEVPVVSTTTGAEGITVSDGENIILADTPEDIANAVLRLFDDRSMVKKLCENGRKLVYEHYAWDIIGKKIISVYTK